jgi:type IV secretion system protein TrbH
MKQVFIVVLALVMSGCATLGNYGSFLPEDQKVVEVKIADDAVKQLIELYPPAKSRFNMKHETKGVFGITLVQKLREAGYAVEEFTKRETTAMANSVGDGLDLGYILDVAGAPDFYRLTMMVSNQSISRPYIRQDTDVLPAGYWARKE